MSYIQECKHCGSQEVARLKWVNVNDDTIYHSESGTSIEWCMECKSETTIIEQTVDSGTEQLLS